MLSQFLAQRIYNPQIIPSIRNFSGWQYLQRLYPILLVLGIIISVVVFVLIIVIGGVQWITSGGDRAAVDSARRKIINGVTGLFLLLLVFFIIIFIGRVFKVNLLGSFNLISDGSVTEIPTQPPTFPPDQTPTPTISIEEQLCSNSGGVWRLYPSGCYSYCNLTFCDPAGAPVWGCDCGPGRCLMGEDCINMPDGPTLTPIPPINTPTPMPTNTLAPTSTPTPRPTNTPMPTITTVVRPTNTPTPTPRPTNTPTPIPTSTPIPTATPTPIPTPTLSLFCYDSDGGQNYTQRGTVTDNTTLPGGEIENVTDYCPSGSILSEYYCNGNYLSHIAYRCSTTSTPTCFNGKCCSWVGQSCSVDSDCCTNYTCQGGTCVSPNILLLEGINTNCANYCILSGFAGCASIGTDDLASNGMMYLYQGGSCVLTNLYNCNTVLYGTYNVCGGHQTDWTRCRCIGTGTVTF